MKREILFKAKRIDNGDWIEGYLINHQNVTGIIPIHAICFTCDGGSLDFYYVDVIPETVCQFSGFLDKKQNKIFEGDKVQAFGGSDYEVIFNDCAFYLKTGPMYYRMSRTLPVLEIIGNIHEN